MLYLYRTGSETGSRIERKIEKHKTKILKGSDQGMRDSNT